MVKIVRKGEYEHLKNMDVNDDNFCKKQYRSVETSF